VPITFGKALVDPYHGFAQYTVAAGDSLSAIAQQWYGDANLWPRIYEANRNQITNPNLIFPGQVLRIPQYDVSVGLASPQTRPTCRLRVCFAVDLRLRL
jgi:nucleoid-associated protein YgaU